MLNPHQIKMAEAMSTELKRQTAQMEIEFEKHTADVQESEAFTPVWQAMTVHNNEIVQAFKLANSHAVPHLAVWEYSYDRMCGAFSTLIDRLHEVEGHTTEKTKTEFDKLLESKKEEHTAVVEEEESKPEPVEESTAEPAAAEPEAPAVEDAPETETKAEPEDPKPEPEPVEEAPAEPDAPIVEDPKPETHTVDMDKPCDMVNECTNGQAHTLNEAKQLATQSGLRVEHMHKPTTEA